MRKNGILLGAAALAAMATILTGCAGTQEKADEAATLPPGSGNLVIVGGALKEENAAVYQKILDLAGADGAVGVLPTASGVPAEAGPNTVSYFSKYGAGARTSVIDITATNGVAEAANPEKAKEIEGKKAIYFTGGDQSRIVEAFRPEAGDSAGYQSLKAVLANGGVIAGTSAGAAMMSDPCIRWGTSTEALLIGVGEKEDKGVGIGKGMGFFPYGITDQHFLRRGRLGRLVVALDATKTKYGFGVEENSAIHADLVTHRIAAIGPKALTFVDMSEATRTDMGYNDIRVSLLGDGDWVDGATGEVHPAEGKQLVEVIRNVNDLDKFRFKDKAVGDEKIQFNIWESQIVADKIKELAVSGSRKVTGSDGNFDILFVRDDETEFYSAGPIAASDADLKEKNVTAVGVLMYIVPRPSARPEAEKLRAAAPAPQP